ncbi:hypothetical protein AgCh_005843 [Apium graveolens]
MNLGSLVSRIYKARYYPKDDFLNTTVAGNPSFIWRSIWESKDPLKSGARWIVGSSKDINILHQPWLADVEHPYISSTTLGLEDAKVVSLMNMDSKSWDVELISDMFNDRDKLCILNIPFSADMNIDKLYWVGEMSGSYSVLSVYKMIQSQKGFLNNSSSSGVWSKLWKIKVPSKVLHVFWRALVGCLPTMTQLFCRRVPVQMVCPVCGVEEETIIHPLVLCPFAAACWHKLHFIAGSLVTDDFKEWFSQMLNRHSKERWSEVAMACWGIWKARNELVWQKKHVQVDNMIKSTFSYFAQWKQTQTFTNIALFPMILREMENSDGEIVYASTGWYWGRVAPKFAESMAVKEELNWSKTVDRNFSRSDVPVEVANCIVNDLAS